MTEYQPHKVNLNPFVDPTKTDDPDVAEVVKSNAAAVADALDHKLVHEIAGVVDELDRVILKDFNKGISHGC